MLGGKRQFLGSNICIVNITHALLFVVVILCETKNCQRFAKRATSFMFALVYGAENNDIFFVSQFEHEMLIYK